MLESFLRIATTLYNLIIWIHIVIPASQTLYTTNREANMVLLKKKHNVTNLGART